SCVTPASIAVSVEPAPPWCTSAAQVGSSADSGTHPAARTLSGSSPSGDGSASPRASTNSASRCRATSTSLVNDVSAPTWVSTVPSVTATRGRAGRSSTHSGSTPPPLYGTYRIGQPRTGRSTMLGGATSIDSRTSGNPCTPCRSRSSTIFLKIASVIDASSANPKPCDTAGTPSFAATSGPVPSIDEYTTTSGRHDSATDTPDNLAKIAPTNSNPFSVSTSVL